jgi:DNA-binding GntR family transcriptional regulator
VGNVIERRTTSAVVAGLLRDEIRRGDLPPGTRLRQEEIASRLGVSTTPVREAFQALQGQGLLTLDPHRGVVVFRPTVQDLRESYEIREALETLAIGIAIPRLTEEGIGELQDILDEMRTTNDDQRWIDLNTAFHARLNEFSGRKRLCDMIEGLRHSTSGYIHMIVRHSRDTGRGDSGHQAILEACRAGDVQRAVAAVRAHLNHTVEQTLSLIEGQPAEDQSPTEP